MPTNPKYDMAEAEFLVNEAAEANYADMEGQIRASEELLKALCSLSMRGLKIERDPRGHVYFVGFDKVVYVGENNGKIFIVEPPATGGKEIKLQYNRNAGIWEGLVADPFRLPVPGEPKRFRSAVAVVAERALEALKKSGTDA